MAGFENSKSGAPLIVCHCNFRLFPTTTMRMKFLCIRNAPDRTFYYPAEYQIYVNYIDGKYPTRLSGQMLDIE